MNNALGIEVVFDFITLIAVETGLEVFVVDVDVDVVGMVDFVDEVFVIFAVTVVIGYWLFDVGITVYQELLSISNLNGLAYGANAQYQMDAQNYTLNKNSGNITSAGNML